MFSSNNKKLRSIFLGLWLLIPIMVLGHSPSNSSTLLVEGKNGQWTLQIRAALTAFEHVVHEEFTAQGYSTPEEFKELAMAILSRNQKLFVNDKEVSLINPQIKLGHDTIVVYEVNLPGDIKTVAYRNTLFQNIYKSKCSFMVFKDGVKKDIFNLDSTNNYAVQLKFENGTFNLFNVQESSSLISTNAYLIIALIIILIMFGLILKSISNQDSNSKKLKKLSQI